MSAGDYISLKKSKMLQNYAPILSSGNKAVANYDHYVRKLAINTVIGTISNDIYGDPEEKTMNNIIINCSEYPANTFDGVLNPTPITLVPNDNIGLNWRAYDGSMVNFVILSGPSRAEYSLIPNFFSTAGPKIGAQGQSSGVTRNISDLSAGTGFNFVGVPNVNDEDSNGFNRAPFVIEWTGYFFCTQSGNWTFNLRTLGRDYSFFWLGPIADSGYNLTNTFIKHEYNLSANPSDIDQQSNTINMVRDTYYKMRIQYSQPSNFQFLSLSFTDPNGITTFDGTKNYFRENIFYFNQTNYPLKSTPSVPAKLQQSCYRGEQPCTTFIHAKRANHISNEHRRQWNQKKKEMLKITDSRTYKM